MQSWNYYRHDYVAGCRNCDGVRIPAFFVWDIFWVCITKLLTTSVNANIFYYRNGKGQLHVWFEKPDAKTFHEFCETLSKKAEEAWNNRPIEPTAQSLAGELAALKRLKDSGGLSDEEFERAKAKLLELTEKRKIGFG
jgi:hypothetical protein